MCVAQRSLSSQTDAEDHDELVQPHVFRLHRSRVYYIREALMRQATSVPRDKLVSLGICVGKFSKTEKFRVHITALDLLAKHAKYKVRSPLP